MQRRLSAILVADVVGFSRLMGVDEAGTLERLKEARRSRFEPLVAEHGGRIIKLTGDGAIVEFASVVEAVRCAVWCSRPWRGGTPAWTEPHRISFRIAVHLGDVMADGTTSTATASMSPPAWRRWPRRAESSSRRRCASMSPTSSMSRSRIWDRRR